MGARRRVSSGSNGWDLHAIHLTPRALEPMHVRRADAQEPPRVALAPWSSHVLTSRPRAALRRTTPGCESLRAGHAPWSCGMSSRRSGAASCRIGALDQLRVAWILWADVQHRSSRANAHALPTRWQPQCYLPLLSEPERPLKLSRDAAGKQWQRKVPPRSTSSPGGGIPTQAPACLASEFHVMGLEGALCTLPQSGHLCWYPLLQARVIPPTARPRLLLRQVTRRISSRAERQDQR